MADGVPSEAVATPVIGICAALEQARYGVWDERVDLLPHDYVAAVERAGGMAILLPVQHVLAADPDQALDRIDALVLAGGADIDPSSYGARAHAQTAGTSPERDAAEVALARRAIERGLPLLGICRGMQLLNIARGGTLEQHVPDLVGTEDHRSDPGAFSNHRVRLTPGSLAARAATEEHHAIKSHHHQAIDKVGDGLVVTGWSESDDLPEAVEAQAHRYVLGVQWHPEADPASAVIKSLVDEVRAER
jgi:putative glutamine amidotransferase